MCNSRSERGSAAVEFALILPILLLVLLGIIEFGQVLTTQISLAQAAREGARVMAIQDNAVEARGAAQRAAPALKPGLTDSMISIIATPTSGEGSSISNDCAPGYQASFTITYQTPSITGLFSSFPVTARGAMRCGG